MGSCFSKKSVCASSPPPAALPDPPEKLKSEAAQPEKKEETVVKKEIFIIKHRKSHEVERQRPEPEEKAEVKKVDEFVEKGNGLDGGGAAAAVRTSSCTKEEVDAILIQCGRLSRSSSTGKAGFSAESGGRKYSGSKRSYDFDNDSRRGDDNNADGDDEAVARERENRRRERRLSQGRRRTPSRERDQAAHQRSGSRERSGSGGGRRVSRSPGRRSESPIATHSGTNSNSSAANANPRPGKLVSVPAMAMEKSTNAAGEAAAAVKRIQVKRNAGGDAARSAASPRARSPARLRAQNDNQNQQQPISLSRSNSRKAEHSPYRRNPLSEIDTNIISQVAPPQKLANTEQKTAGNNGGGVNVIPPAVTRTRSSRLSRDLDINPETLANPNSSYTALLLEDIHNFHQNNAPPASFPLPPCVTKACSILEAVADLNSSTEQIKARKAKQDPIVESEIVGSDDLMQPSFHKYVTVRRGAGDDEDLEEQESSGSNSFVGSQQQWACSSSWEPNSAESTRSVGYQRHTAASESARVVDEGSKKLGAAKNNGIGRARIASRVSHTVASSA
ncbi:uncharacterized protein At1g65710-like [Salvia hispanica]|uniref:uncharacterized protein At1g65710-like n=1 Tax=Salvia hispanica TaxID=49212 RepID=UPI0020090DA4|nr:uncharacterized protein At1g65710-like [Salvia hispanica]